MRLEDLKIEDLKRPMRVPLMRGRVYLRAQSFSREAMQAGARQERGHEGVEHSDPLRRLC